MVGVRPQPARCVSVGVNKDWISSCTQGDVKVGTVIAATWDEKVPYIQDTLQTVPNTLLASEDIKQNKKRTMKRFLWVQWSCS